MTATPTSPNSQNSRTQPQTEVAKLEGIYKPSNKITTSLGICIYGRSGVGKTTLLSTMPGKGLLIDVPQIEGGTQVLSAAADKIDIKAVNTYSDIDHVFWFLQKQAHDYKWVAIDSITAFTELAKRKTIKERDISADPHTISLQEWGKIGTLVGELIYRFRTLPIHTIWVGQERKYGSDSEPTMIGPDTTPGALSDLLPSMTLVGRLYVENLPSGEAERRLRIAPHPLYHAKARSLPSIRVPRVVRNPNIGMILAYLYGQQIGGKSVVLDEVDESADFFIIPS